MKEKNLRRTPFEPESLVHEVFFYQTMPKLSAAAAFTKKLLENGEIL